MGDSQCAPGTPVASGGVAPLSHSVGISHGSHSLCSPTSSPDTLAADIVSQMGEVIQQVSQQVAQNIISHLSPSVITPLANAAFSPANTAISPNDTATSSANADKSASNPLDASHVQFLSHRKLKDPPCFRGDGSDSVPVREWEDLMRDFIKKGNLRPEDQAKEILVHLRGQARDGVRFGTRNSDTSCRSILIQRHAPHSHWRTFTPLCLRKVRMRLTTRSG